MTKTDLKPTTKEERQDWRDRFADPEEPLLDGLRPFAVRLIADVERLERFETALKRIAQRPGDTVYDAWKIALEALNAK